MLAPTNFYSIFASKWIIVWIELESFYSQHVECLPGRASRSYFTPHFPLGFPHFLRTTTYLQPFLPYYIPMDSPYWNPTANIMGTVLQSDSSVVYCPENGDSEAATFTWKENFPWPTGIRDRYSYSRAKTWILCQYTVLLRTSKYGC